MNMKEIVLGLALFVISLASFAQNSEQNPANADPGRAVDHEITFTSNNIASTVAQTPNERQTRSIDSLIVTIGPPN